MPGELHRFTDYVVGCDNALACEAVSLVPQAAISQEAAAGQPDPWTNFGVLKVTRNAGPDAPLMVTISDFEGTPTRLLQGDSAVEARLVAAGDGEWRIEAADLHALLDTLYGDTLTVQDARGAKLGEFALSDLREALLYIDERQGRLGTAGAALRTGRRPNAVVPAPPPLPTVRAAAPTTERALTLSAAEVTQARRAQGCTADEVGTLNVDEQTFHALGGGRTLVMMGCGSGAYNAGSVPLIASREGGRLRVEPARFDIGPDSDDPHGRRLLTNAEFNAATMTIHEWAKGRGLGDCGVAADYVWDGAMFRLTEQGEMSECRGALELITTWRARVVR